MLESFVPVFNTSRVSFCLTSLCFLSPHLDSADLDPLLTDCGLDYVHVCGDDSAVALDLIGLIDSLVLDAIALGKNECAQITRHLSPYEQQIVMPWLRSFPKRAYEKFMGSFVYWGGAAVLTLGTASLSDSLDAAQDREHRF